MAFLSHLISLNDFLDAKSSPLCWASEWRNGGPCAVIAIDLHPEVRTYIAAKSGSTGILQFDGSIGTPGRANFKNGRCSGNDITGYGPPEVHVLAVLSSSSLAMPIMSALHDRFIKQFGGNYTARLIGR